MEVEDFQKLLAEHARKWDKKRGGTPTKEESFIHLVEEVGELAQQYFNEKRRKDRYSFAEVENALADILLQVVRLAEFHNLDLEKIVKKMIDEERGVILVDAVDAFVVEDKGTFKIFKEMHDLLETLPNRKIILTGANDEQFKEFGLDKMPYEVFTLKHNPEKTNPEYYKKMLEHLGLTHEDVIYFEHNPEAVKSAQSVGIKTFHYDPDKKDLQTLKSYLIENL